MLLIVTKLLVPNAIHNYKPLNKMAYRKKPKINIALVLMNLLEKNLIIPCSKLIEITKALVVLSLLLKASVRPSKLP